MVTRYLGDFKLLVENECSRYQRHWKSLNLQFFYRTFMVINKPDLIRKVIKDNEDLFETGLVYSNSGRYKDIHPYVDYDSSKLRRFILSRRNLRRRSRDIHASFVILDHPNIDNSDVSILLMNGRCFYIFTCLNITSLKQIKSVCITNVDYVFIFNDYSDEDKKAVWASEMEWMGISYETLCNLLKKHGCIVIDKTVMTNDPEKLVKIYRP